MAQALSVAVVFKTHPVTLESGLKVCQICGGCLTTLCLPLWSPIPRAATFCSPRLCSFSTKFKLKTLRPPALSTDEALLVSRSLESLVMCVLCRWCGRGDAQMPRSCSSRTSPKDDVVMLGVVRLVAEVHRAGPKCCCWDEEVLMCSQFLWGGRLKVWRLQM